MSRSLHSRITGDELGARRAARRTHRPARRTSTRRQALLADLAAA